MPKSTATFRRVTFRVTTGEALPTGEQVFVSGNVPELGNWTADAIPLTRVGDTLWEAAVDLPVDEPIEFKVTRGSWETEEARRGPGPWPNRELAPGRNRKLEIKVSGWRDD